MRMKNSVKITGWGALLSFLLTLPFMVMEIVNRWQYHEVFPYALFAGLWLNLLAITLIVLPIV